MGIKEKVLILLLATISCFETHAQLSIDRIVSKYNSYQEVIPLAKIHLSLNQQKFIPGDTVYFTAYFLSDDLIGVPDKQLLDLHLVDPEGNSIIHFKYDVKDGFGYNQFALPASLNAGIYHIVSYSSWTRNFGEDYIFKKEIQVVNDKELITKPTPKIGIEGGSLIADVPNKVVVTGLNNLKSVQLKNDNNEIITNAAVSQDGMINMVFVPQQDQTYSIISEKGLKLDFPKPTKDGYSISYSRKANQELNVKLYTPQDSKYIDKELFLIITSRSRVIYSAKFKQSVSGVTNLNLPSENMSEGLGYISLLDQSGSTIAMRTFYSQNGATQKAKVKLNKVHFEPRESVQLQFSFDNIDKTSIKNISLRVINKSLFSSPIISLNDELNVLSSIKNDFSINRSDSGWQESLDHNLIVSGGGEDWNIILTNQQPKASYSFSSIMRKSGIAFMNDSTNERVSEGTKILFYMQSSMWRYETSVLKNGEVWLMIPEHYQKDEIYYFAENHRGRRISGLSIKWNKEELQSFVKPMASVESEEPDVYGQFAGKNRFVHNSFSFFSNNDSIQSKKEGVNPNQKFEQRVYGADINVNIQDYQIFPTMVEMIREIIPSVIHRGREEGGYVRVTLPQPMDLSSDNPLFVINGIVTKDVAYFLSLKPADILQVKVVNNPMKLIPLGLFGKNGIIMIQTKNGEERPPLNHYNVIDGMNRRVDYNNLNFENTSDSKYPHFKSTIYWNPSLVREAIDQGEVQFYLSDDVGEMLIYLEGITNDGVPFSTSQIINVKIGN